MEVRRRVLRALMIVPLVLACVAGVARAEVYYNDASDGDYEGLVAGYEYGEQGKHRAAMEYLGYDWDSIGSVQQARLRTNSGGKNPYMAVYEQTLNVQYEFADGVANIPIASVWSGIFGLSNMWYIGGVTREDWQVAHDYVEKVITGTGGGSSGTDEPETAEGYTLIPVQDWAPHEHTGVLDVDYVAIKTEGYQQIAEYAKANNQDILARVARDSSVSGDYARVMVMTAPKDGVAFMDTGEGGNSNRHYVCKWIKSFASKRSNSIYQVGGILTIAGKKCAPATSNLQNHNYPANTYDGWYPIQMYSWVGDTVTIPPEPAPEPDPPTVAPTPPEQPTYVFEPVIGVDLPTVTIETDPVSSEILDWLKLIHRDLSRISGELNEYLEDASNAIVAAINNQGAALRRWFDTLSTQINDVYTYLVTMQERYLDELDRDITNWLKRIYSRLGGNGTAKPDPNEDEKGFWDWILEQLQKFFVGNVEQTADGIKGLLQQLTQFFPFSLPWDLMALFGLFAAEPVTPVFDVNLPVPAVISADYGETLHIDLHQWDGTMRIVRGLEKIFFAAWLISMVPSWLNDIKVGDM